MMFRASEERTMTFEKKRYAMDKIAYWLGRLYRAGVTIDEIWEYVKEHKDAPQLGEWNSDVEETKPKGS
jgi:hypothetical protein